MRVSPAALAPFRREKSLKIVGEIVKQLSGRSVENLCSNGHLYDHVSSFPAVSVRSLAMAAAFRMMLRVVSQVQKRVQAFIGLEPNVAAFAAVAAGRSAARDELLTAKGRNAVSAVAGLNSDLYAIDKHRDYLI
jgi:hypothetical protein